ncbi:MAG TPA: hypothetical protein PK747_06395 [Acidobacteriota bacterium]|jgi:hypothetical protein|nr:hypothetical protein [Acidobacteriota bacterium]HNT17011.1 hypothetical protein [Acidobacteriota bacterium]HPA27191.1 hypothetical protein [Acidobacteriota bacterium]HQO20344.1 hypothetical protein [Acidobacteriota bacterium]HQQ47022.1 hypothetical protein [Acidobacteriota bacterium]
MRKALLILAATLLFVSGPVLADEWFDIEMRVMTTGENQPQREIGVFGAELPLSGKGYLERSLTVRNMSRNTSNVVDFKLTMKPERGRQGELHLIFTSDATPKTGKPESRFRDLVFDKPGGQIVEIFSDPQTGTRLIISLLLKPKEIKEELTANLKVLWKSRVEKVSRTGKEQIDSFDLRSVGSAPVGRTLTHSVPVWVPGEGGELKVEGLKDLDKATTIVTVKAGEGFTYTPETSKKEARKKEKEEKKRKKDSRLPAFLQQEEKEAPEEVQASETPPPDAGVVKSTEEPQRGEPPGSYNWEKEDFSFDVVSEAEPGGTVKATVRMNGSIFDQEKKTLVVLPEKTETRSFSNGEIAVLHTSDEAGEGYSLTLQAQF